MISLVLPIYNEEGNIKELYTRSINVLKKFGDYEIIFVNDGSRDKSLTMLKELARKDKRVKILDFSRNFGHQIAITAGLDYATGDAVVVMDSDLQDTPETIEKMVAKWKKGFDVVYAKRRSRKDTFFKKSTAFLFYRTLRKIANIDIPEDTGDFRLMDQKVVKEMRKLREHSRFMRGLTSWLGFKQTFVLFDREDRKYGTTGYPLKKMIKLAIDAITSFSYFPLRVPLYIGIVVSFIGLTSLMILAFKSMNLSTLTIISNILIGILILVTGIQLILLGILGEYIGRIYTEVQNRPLYVLNDKINFD